MSLIESQPPAFPAVGDNLAVNAARIPVKDSRWSQDGFVRLEFENWTDLSTKLVMLPRIEAEGRGAVIASYESKEQDSKSHVQKITSNQNLEDSSPAENRDDSDDHHSLQQHGEKVYEGLVFEGIQNKQDSWREKEFTDILALLREERNSPLVLCFSSTQQSEQSAALEVEGEEKKENDTPSKSEPSSTFQRNGKEATVTPQESLQAGMSALSSWGMRVRAQASEAATNLSTVAKTLQGPPKDTIQTKLKEKTCDIYLQTSVGAYVPVSRAQSKVTTSSLLFIRKSATEAPPRKGWSYQWYRSTIIGEKQFDDAASSASNRTNESGGNSTVSPVDPFPVTGEIEWIAINGANGASFQPDATTIGRKLRCILTMQQKEDTISSDESSECTDDNCSDLASVEDMEEICEINGVVQADPTLFNGARTALARGAKFGGLKGRGNAEGRQFRLEVSIGMPSRKRSRRTTSALHIFQMSGNESISLTSAPILGTTARIVGTSPKHMDLQIAVPAESVLSALCTNGYFQVETPNRLSRESFLMTLGIANYQGKPADLDTQTVLFRDRPPLQLCLVDEEASQVITPRPARKLTDPVASPEFMISPIASVTTLPSSPIASPNLSLMATSQIATTKTEEQSRIAAMEEEIQFLRGKLTRKDKVVSELQRQITQSDSAHEDTRQKLRACQKDLEHSKKEQQRMTHKLKKTENSIQSHEDKLNRVEGEHAQQVSVLSATIESQNTKIADLEKSNKVLRNDKAILQATVEARDSKLVRMTALQSSYDELAVKISQQDEIKAELEASQKQYTDMQQTVLQMESSGKDCRSKLEAAQKTIVGLKEQVELERSKVLSCKAQVDPLQKSIQQLKGERNSYKQKNDSLSKEVSRLCKNGRSIKDIERIVNEYQSLSEEIESLRRQKKKALEEAHEYRTSYAQSKAAQALSGVEQETQAALERNVELSRLLAETTEYINAKEMQLETMKQVNEQLQDEIRSLARANLRKNEI